MGSMPDASYSTMFLNLLQGSVLAYASLLPMGTWRVQVIDAGILVFMQPAISVLLAVSMIALQLSRESYAVLPSSTFMHVRPLQSSNLKILHRFISPC